MSSLQNMTSGNTRSTAASILLDLPRDELIAGSELTLLQEIGRGSSGMVYKAMWRGVDVAVKQLRSEQLSEKEMRDFVAEILMMKSLRPHGELMQKE
jgi:serine/threonine protein kinase